MFVVITLAQTLVIQGGVVEDAKNAETQDTKRSKRTKPQDADKKVDHMKPPVFAKRKNEKEASNVEEEHNRHKRKKQQKKHYVLQYTNYQSSVRLFLVKL